MQSVVKNAIDTIRPISGKEQNTLVYHDFINNLTIVQNKVNREIITFSKGIIKQ